MTKATKTYIARSIAAVALAACALCLAWAFATPQAYANKQLESPVNVSDDITRLHVNKLDRETHEPVTGATMAIIEKDTGTVVDEWVTDGTTHEIEKGLNVNVVYVLREMSAPTGYGVAADTEFIINELEGTGITIVNGNDAELFDSYKVNIYDQADATNVTTTVYRDRETPTGATTQSESKEQSSSSTSKTVAPKTGDETPIAPIAAGVAGCAAAIVVLQLVKRRFAKKQE